MTKRLKPAKSPTYAYTQFWRLVDGAVRDCFAAHPEYIPAGKAERAIRNSIVKRVTGLALGYAVEAARGRSVEKTAAEKEAALLHADLPHAGRVGSMIRMEGGDDQRPPLNLGGLT